MSDFSDFHTAALAEVMALLGSPVLYNGRTYTAVVNDIELSNELKPGGFEESLSNVVIIQRSSIVVPPKAGERMTVNGRQARIESVRQDEVAYEIHVKTATK